MNRNGMIAGLAGAGLAAAVVGRARRTVKWKLCSAVLHGHPAAYRLRIGSDPAGNPCGLYFGPESSGAVIAECAFTGPRNTGPAAGIKLTC